MTKKEVVKNAYEKFYEYVENSVDENGWIKREEHSGFMRNHFYLSNNIETKFIDKVEYWRPKTLEGIEDNNGWIIIRSEADLPREYGLYNLCHIDKDGYLPAEPLCALIAFYNTKTITHYQPITKPNPPLWTK